MKYISTLISIINKVNEWAGRILAPLVLVLISVILYEVVARGLFNSPTRWTHETSGFLLAGLTVLGGGYLLLERGHINVDILYKRFSLRQRAIIDSVTFIAFFLFVLILVWKGGGYAWRSLMYWETSGTAWNPPIWIASGLIPIGAFLLLLQGLAHFIKGLVIAVTGVREA